MTDPKAKAQKIRNRYSGIICPQLSSTPAAPRLEEYAHQSGPRWVRASEENYPDKQILEQKYPYKKIGNRWSLRVDGMPASGYFWSREGVVCFYYWIHYSDTKTTDFSGSILPIDFNRIEYLIESSTVVSPGEDF